VKNLIVILGPTGIGKTNLSIEIAQLLNTEIISADSRQIYKEMTIGTAIPEAQQLNTVKHHFIQNISIHDYFNVSYFEQQVLSLLEELFLTHDHVIMTGGSMMYIDVVCYGIDDLPDIDSEIRSSLLKRFETEGLEPLINELKIVDPLYYHKVDLKNHLRIMHALEVCYQTGKPYSELLTQPKKERPFNIIKIGLNTERNQLYDRINQRVDIMVSKGLVDEAKELYLLRNLPSLNTVGYKELFSWLDGAISLEEAIQQIKNNSRRYARKQLTWFRRDKEITWFDPENKQAIINFVLDKTKK
jgi:tRNA dimethylallyltransferase